MIINIGALSIWAGNIPLKKNTFLPKFSFLNGGCYWKASILWFKFLLELSGPKRDNRKYKKVTKEYLEKVLLEHYP